MEEWDQGDLLPWLRAQSLGSQGPSWPLSQDPPPPHLNPVRTWRYLSHPRPGWPQGPLRGSHIAGADLTNHTPPPNREGPCLGPFKVRSSPARSAGVGGMGVGGHVAHIKVSRSDALGPEGPINPSGTGAWLGHCNYRVFGSAIFLLAETVELNLPPANPLWAAGCVEKGGSQLRWVLPRTLEGIGDQAVGKTSL